MEKWTVKFQGTHKNDGAMEWRELCLGNKTTVDAWAVMRVEQYQEYFLDLTSHPFDTELLDG